MWPADAHITSTLARLCAAATGHRLRRIASTNDILGVHTESNNLESELPGCVHAYVHEKALCPDLVGPFSHTARARVARYLRSRAVGRLVELSSFTRYLAYDRSADYAVVHENQESSVLKAPNNNDRGDNPSLWVSYRALCFGSIRVLLVLLERSDPLRTRDAS